MREKERERERERHTHTERIKRREVLLKLKLFDQISRYILTLLQLSLSLYLAPSLCRFLCTLSVSLSFLVCTSFLFFFSLPPFFLGGVVLLLCFSINQSINQSINLSIYVYIYISLSLSPSLSFSLLLSFFLYLGSSCSPCAQWDGGWPVPCGLHKGHSKACSTHNKRDADYRHNSLRLASIENYF